MQDCVYISYLHISCYLEIIIEKGVTNITLNFGPQHPAAHGVLRLVLELNGEVCFFKFTSLIHVVISKVLQALICFESVVLLLFWLPSTQGFLLIMQSIFICLLCRHDFVDLYLCIKMC